MKKKKWVIPSIIVAVVVLLAVAFVPIQNHLYDDGGTREYVALTYKIVDWNRSSDSGLYDKTCVYFGSDRNKSINELWEIEKDKTKHKFVARVLESNTYDTLVEPYEASEELKSIDKIRCEGGVTADVGDLIEITYYGQITKSIPAQIKLYSWVYAFDAMRKTNYTAEWIDKSKQMAEKDYIDLPDYFTITKIYADCFFATPSYSPMPYKIKINGKLSNEWCVGDNVHCTYNNIYTAEEFHIMEADLLTIEEDNLESNTDEMVAYKPVIYLYPENKTKVDVNLSINGKLTCTYPDYKNGWTVTAMPDGTLTDKKGKVYNYLYWEGEINAEYDLSKGFCVKGEDTAEFLENALDKLGLTRKEANEFIVYWLPFMQNNQYNIISFQDKAYTDAAKLKVTPSPDTLIRVFMTWQKSDSFVNLPEQKLTSPKRNGFTVVEWGGTELR